LDRAGGWRGAGYQFVDEAVILAFWISGIVLLSGILMFYLVKTLKKIERKQWW
jgi:hypothetical protein